MEKKYKLTDVIIKAGHIILHRIEALRDFGNVKKGDKGGFIEKESNLSHEGTCWVYNDAMVYGDARVCSNATLNDCAEVYGRAVITDNAFIGGYAKVHDQAIIKGKALIYEWAEVYNQAIVAANAAVYHYAKIYEHAKVGENATIYGHAKIHGNSFVNHFATISDADIHGLAHIMGDAKIIGDAIIKSNKDYIVFKNWWSSGRYFTWTRSNNMWSVGCFHGTGEQLIAKAYKDSELSGREYERIVKYVEAINK